MSQDYFQHKAHQYEQDNRRVDNVGRIADAITRRVTLSKTMQLLDFGAGTGLLLANLAPYVSKITAVDISPAMNAQLESKRSQLPCALEIQAVNLEQVELPLHVDGIVTSMTMHHIDDIAAMLQKFRRMLLPEGFIAIADLCLEDGRFHEEDTGVKHHGFDPAVMVQQAQQAGFTELQTAVVSVIQKPQGDYPVFLLTGRLAAENSCTDGNNA